MPHVIFIKRNLLEATQAQEGLGIGFLATELLVESHGIVGVAGFKDVATIIVGNVEIHGAFLLEALPTVGLKHLRPQVGVVATSILLIIEDVLEIGTAIAILNDLGHVQSLGNRALKSFDIDIITPVDFVPFNVEQSRTHELGCHKALIELR